MKPGGALDRLMSATPISGAISRRARGPALCSAIAASRREFLIRRADRLLFGTDYLRPGQPVPQFDLSAGFDLPADARAKIERGNAARLLGLKA